MRASTRIVIGSLLAWSALAGFGAGAQTIRLQTFDTLPTQTKPEVLGANPAKKGDWPATFVFRNETGAGCTATAIGPRAILTAAHCMRDMSTAAVLTETQDLTITCSHHPKYQGDISADFALCLVNSDLPKFGGVGFEKVNTDPGLVAKGKRVDLLGYGCLVKGGQDKSFGTLYHGDTAVITDASLGGYANYVTTTGGAAVCFGDSGGGAYLPGPGGVSRRLFAVNSRGDINTVSWLSVTHLPDFMNWASAWATQNATKICGIHADAPNCRQ
jgi:hypothetical protein